MTLLPAAPQSGQSDQLLRGEGSEEHRRDRRVVPRVLDAALPPQHRHLRLSDV